MGAPDVARRPDQPNFAGRAVAHDLIDARHPQHALHVGLHIDALERLAGDAGHKAVEAAHALMLRATAMCEQALAHAQKSEPAPRRRTVEAVAAIRQVAELISPIAPEGFGISIHAEGLFPATADANHLFRILFNPLHNAVSVARSRAKLKTVDISVERWAASVVVREYLPLPSASTIPAAICTLSKANWILESSTTSPRLVGKTRL